MPGGQDSAAVSNARRNYGGGAGIHTSGAEHSWTPFLSLSSRLFPALGALLVPRVQLPRSPLCTAVTLCGLGRLMVYLGSSGCGAPARNLRSGSEPDLTTSPTDETANWALVIVCHFLRRPLETCYALRHIVMICGGTHTGHTHTLRDQRRCGGLTKPTWCNGIHGYLCVHSWSLCAPAGHRGTWSDLLGAEYLDGSSPST